MSPFSLHHFCFRFAIALPLVIGVMICAPLKGEEVTPPKSALPEGPVPVTEANFAALKASSPFHRSLNLSDSLILTGIARVDGDLLVTLTSRETREPHIVSNAANPLGWRLVSVKGDETDLKAMTVQISVASGEVFSVRYDALPPKPVPRRPGSPGGPPGGGGAPTTRDYRQGVSGDGFPGPPPPEIVKKLSQLQEDQRQRIFTQIREVRDKNRDMSSEDRQVLFGRMVDKALQEKR